MAAKTIYTAVAVLGIGAASGAAWWYQNKPAAAVGTQAMGAAQSVPQDSARGAAQGARDAVDTSRHP